MPISIANLRLPTRTVTIAFGDESVTLTFDPNRLTAEVEAVDTELRAQGRTAAATAYVLAQSIVSWDILDDDGQPLPITVETLERFSVEVLTYLASAISKDYTATPRLVGQTRPAIVA